MNIDAWTIDRIAYLKNLKNCTDKQQLLILLAEKTELDLSNKRKLLMLIDDEKTAVREIRKRQVISNLRGTEI
jgi:hypothetical protein